MKPTDRGVEETWRRMPEVRRDRRREQLELLQCYALTLAIGSAAAALALILTRITWFVWFEI